MAKQIIDGQKIEIKQKHRYPEIEFDKLQMLFCFPYTIDLESARGSIKLLQPTIGNIMEMGEKKFYSGLNPFITNAASYKLILWEAGKNWNDISDFELFLMLFQSLNQEVCNMLFENFELNNFTIVKKINEESKEVFSLYSEVDDVEINEEVYQHVHQYLQNIFNMFPEEKYTKDKILQKWWIDKEKRDLEHSKSKGEKESYSILPLISACTNHPGFKYNLRQLKDVGVFQFYDSVKRLQIYESTTALLKGMYSGMIDGSKIKSEEYNFMKET